MKKSFIVCTIAVTALLLLSSCEQTPVDRIDTAKSPSITGTLLKSDGKTPARGAVVTLYPRDAMVTVSGVAKKAALPNKVMVPVAANGTFSIDSCAIGVYALEGTDADGNSVRLDSVEVTGPSTTTDVAKQSLMSTGALKGNVFLDNGGNPDNVFILVFGSERFMQVKSDGSYYMDNLPYGNFTLKFVCVAKECGLCKTVSITVAPSKTTTVDDVTLSVPEVGVPANVKLLYDSLRMLVTLTWDPCEDAGITGYNIYRYNTANAQQYPPNPVNSIPVTSTSYTDYDVELDQNYVYGVTSVSVNGSISRKTNPLKVTAVGGAYDIDSIAGTSSRLFYGVHFDANNQLVIARGDRYLGDNGKLLASLILDFYNSDFSFGHSVILADSTNQVYSIVLTDSYVVFNYENPFNDNDELFVRWDSLVYCFSYTGEKRYTANFHRAEVINLAERNDTLYVETDTRAYSDTGSVATNAYDTSGNRLFTISTEIQNGDDGNLYAITNENTGRLFRVAIMRLTPQTNSFEEVNSITQERRTFRYWSINVKNKMYYLSSAPELATYNAEGALHSRIRMTSSNSWFPQKFTVNTSGIIAVTSSNKVILFKPKK